MAIIVNLDNKSSGAMPASLLQKTEDRGQKTVSQAREARVIFAFSPLKRRGRKVEKSPSATLGVKDV